MAIKIKVPNKHFNGIRGGFQFNKGEAIVEDEEKGRKLAKDFGYEVEEIKKKTTRKTTTKKTTTKKTTTKKASTKKSESK